MSTSITQMRAFAIMHSSYVNLLEPLLLLFELLSVISIIYRPILKGLENRGVINYI